ncbi:MAG: sugar transferase [Thermaerobacter sp.]|nr:sugar transferase [Thermaerobacter sp.]
MASVGFAAGVKRWLDLTVSLGLLIVALPLLLALGILIRLDSDGPALYRQTRIGQQGRPFVMWKFRTMRLGAEREWVAPSDADALETFLFQDRGDVRITRLGQWLRQTSLDELPQLYNVLRGEMSLVGPRPEIPEMVALYSPEMHGRHVMKPGITGLAQVSGRGALTTQETVRLDLEYCRHWSLGLDLRILLMTIASVLRKKGAW